MARPKKQKIKWKNREDYSYDEEWNDLRDESWERLIIGEPEK